MRPRSKKTFLREFGLSYSTIMKTFRNSLLYLIIHRKLNPHQRKRANLLKMKRPKRWMMWVHRAKCLHFLPQSPWITHLFRSKSPTIKLPYTKWFLQLRILRRWECYMKQMHWRNIFFWVPSCKFACLNTIYNKCNNKSHLHRVKRSVVCMIVLIKTTSTTF